MNTMNKRAHPMHSHPEMTLVEQTCMKPARLKEHPTLGTLSFNELAVNCCIIRNRLHIIPNLTSLVADCDKHLWQVLVAVLVYLLMPFCCKKNNQVR